jgi:uncharacterized protein (DUF1800 family)
MIQAEAGFAERWAELWSNHLSISRQPAAWPVRRRRITTAMPSVPTFSVPSKTC